jgi:hypothetical protein
MFIKIVTVKCTIKDAMLHIQTKTVILPNGSTVLADRQHHYAIPKNVCSSADV